MLLFISISSNAQHSMARQWNEVVLEAIRNDLARPTVHARNLFHTSAAMYDAWAAYEENAKTYFLGNTVHGFDFPFDNDFEKPADRRAAQEEAMSYAVFRLIFHRFLSSPGVNDIFSIAYDKFLDLGYNPNFTSSDYQSGRPAALGNYIAEKIIQYGLQDGANEQRGYANRYYQPVNPPLIVDNPGNDEVLDPNRWQPLTLDVFIDQSGNEIPGATPAFLGPEWGSVAPFALTEDDLTIYEREGAEWWVYHDPGPPPYTNTSVDEGYLPDEYKWSFSLVSIWSSHLDPTDGVMWDISPGARGNIDFGNFPQTFEAYRDFYDLIEGGDIGQGREINPYTGQPYEPQLVPRGDYTRVLAEFWADGPDSETPPGHWFTILNYVHDHPAFQRRFKGEGEALDDLEWDVKAYFTLGGAMHDVAISAWGVKGWYDYIRPVCAIRYLCSVGQSSDPGKPRYSPYGLKLIPGYIEMVEAGDPLAGPNNQNVGKIKLYAWRGPNYIQNPETDDAGVGWILADNWWPYQRPTFITPPFAGYVSGHSTYSRAAAEVLTLLTGDEYFPGGMGEFVARKNEFLVFEEGPSQDIVLQWATYQDASDQTSLSRIWGGIHPPADDIPGRIMGRDIGIAAFLKAETYFSEQSTDVSPDLQARTLQIQVAPNPVAAGAGIQIRLDELPSAHLSLELFNSQGVKVRQTAAAGQTLASLPTDGLPAGMYVLRVANDDWAVTRKVVVR
jgi:hypothetical protein